MSAVPSNVDLIKQLDSKVAKQWKKSEAISLVRCSQTSLWQLKDVSLSTMAKKESRERKEKRKKGKKKPTFESRSA